MTNRWPHRLKVRVRFIAIALVFLGIFTVPIGVGSYGTEYWATARTAAVGKLTVLWGNPFEGATVSYGTGWQRVALRGWAYASPNMANYYSFDEMKLAGSVHAQWTNASNSYTLDATISLNTQDTPYMPTYIVPNLNAFAVLGTDFTPDSSVTLTTNGAQTHFQSIAAIIAAVPGQFDFKGQYRATNIIFYVSTYFQIILSWSQQSQTVRQVYEPACSRLLQSVWIAW